MKTSKQLKEERASLITEQETLVRSAGENLEGENLTKFDDLQSRIEGFKSDIERAEKFEANQKRMAANNGMVINEPVKEERAKPFSFIRAINNVINSKSHEGAEKEAFEAASDQLRASGLKTPKRNQVAIPSELLVRAQSVTGDSGTKGGKLVASTPQEVMPLLPSLTLAQMGATVHNGLVGDMPLISGDAFEFGYVAENGSAPEADVDYDGPVLQPKRLSGVVNVSNQWLVQTSPSAEANLRGLIAAGIESAIAKAAIVGGGTYGPDGLYDTITTNVSAGAAGAPTWGDVVELETMIKSANATKENLYYLSDPALMGKLKTTAKDTGSGIFLVGQEDNLNGKNYLASTLVGTLDAGASHPLIYGDFKQMHVGFWSGVTFTVDPYTKSGDGITRIIFNIYNDVAVANEKAFAIRKNFTV